MSSNRQYPERQRVFCSLLAVCLVACGETVQEPTSDTTSFIEIRIDSMDTFIGDSVQLSAFGIDDEGATFREEDFSWSSTNPDLLVVGDSGWMVVRGAGRFCSRGFSGATRILYPQRAHKCL